jgi:hypothetical protein
LTPLRVIVLGGKISSFISLCNDTSCQNHLEIVATESSSSASSLYATVQRIPLFHLKNYIQCRSHFDLNNTHEAVKLEIKHIVETIALFLNLISINFQTVHLEYKFLLQQLFAVESEAFQLEYEQLPLNLVSALKARERPEIGGQHSMRVQLLNSTRSRTDSSPIKTLKKLF